MRLRIRLAAAALVAALSLWAVSLPAQVPSGTPTPAPADLARALQKRYAGIRDFRADFTQSVRGGVLRTVTTEQRGDVKIKKPGRMRWTYGAPDRHVFVADGTRVYFYTPNDRTVHTSPMPAGDDMSAAVLFLTGTGNLERDFTHTMPAAQPAGEWQITLAPKVAQEDFSSLTLSVDRTTLAFRGFTWKDHGGTENTIRFTNLRENVGLKDAEFAFTIPKGTHIVSGGGGR